MAAWRLFFDFVLNADGTDFVLDISRPHAYTPLGTPVPASDWRAKECSMDRTEKPKARSEFANSSELKESDAAAVDPTARDVSNAVRARPRSEVTGRHDAGSGANETIDGLTSCEEEVRRGAEELPIGMPSPEPEDLPVFDRAGALPKV
jgi:hypothetical protein